MKLLKILKLAKLFGKIGLLNQNKAFYFLYSTSINIVINLEIKQYDNE